LKAEGKPQTLKVFSQNCFRLFLSQMKWHGIGLPGKPLSFFYDYYIPALPCRQSIGLLEIVHLPIKTSFVDVLALSSDIPVPP